MSTSTRPGRFTTLLTSGRSRPLGPHWKRTGSAWKIRQIHQEIPGRIQVVLVRQPVGF